jgi:SAM-dependent MidA family methyltransferase
MPDLRTFLDQTFARCGGEMSFEDFMAMALYDPEIGYYTTGISDVGGRVGDFATSASLSGALGKAIAGWIRSEMRPLLAKGGPVHLIEVGGGNGALAAAVLKSLGWWRRRRVRYHLVEISPRLQEKQRETLARYDVTWHGEIATALRSAEGRALIFSNELVDAFPAKWLRWNAGADLWEEIFVSYDAATGLKEVFRPCPPDLDPETYSALALPNRSDGQRIEILPAFRHWINNLSLHWKTGAMLTIDYGSPEASGVYHRRSAGTMRAYFRHERIEGGGVYSRIGRQDLTADVNFADLMRWGEALGWETVSLATQREFLERYGVGADLLAGEGVGEAFQVLMQRKLE